MNEREWVEDIKKVISENLSRNIKVDTQKKLAYTNEIYQYSSNFEPSLSSSQKDQKNPNKFETDLLIYEQKGKIIIPRVVIEAKWKTISTHDAITYNHKAQCHKNITPFLRYGIILGNRVNKNNAEKKLLPWRLFKHGSDFDFMVSFHKEKLTEKEKESFIKLLKREISYSRRLEEINNQYRDSEEKNYFILQKQLYPEY
jgi:hypothetical protein